MAGVSGISVKDIAKLSPSQFSKLPENMQRKLASRLVSATNKRIRRLAHSGVSTKEVNKVVRRGEFSIKGNTPKQIQRKMQQMHDILSNPDYTVRGARKVQKLRKDIANKKRKATREGKAKIQGSEKNLDKFIKKLHEHGVKNVGRSNIERLLKEFKKLTELRPELAQKEYKYRNFGDMADFDTNDDGLDALEMFNYLYQNEMHEREQYMQAVSNYFVDVE